MDVVSGMIEGFLREVAVTVPELVSLGRGRSILGAVPGRSREEDDEIEVDRVCDDLLETWAYRSGLDVDIHSEHGFRKICAGAPEYLVAVDPFDGSGLLRRGLAAEWWSVLSVYRADTLEPVAGGAVDVLRQELYLANKAEVTLTPLSGGAPSSLSPGTATALDDSTIIAAFLMDPSYLTGWTQRARHLLDALVKRAPGARLWPNGGSCIYPWLARGLVHAYLMFDEPRTETDPGLAFAQAAGYPVFSVTTDFRLEPYRFVPGQGAGRTPFLIAACTESLARDLVGLVKSPDQR